MKKLSNKENKNRKYLNKLLDYQIYYVTKQAATSQQRVSKTEIVPIGSLLTGDKKRYQIHSKNFQPMPIDSFINKAPILTKELFITFKNNNHLVDRLEQLTNQNVSVYTDMAWDSMILTDRFSTELEERAPMFNIYQNWYSISRSGQQLQDQKEDQKKQLE